MTDRVNPNLAFQREQWEAYDLLRKWGAVYRRRFEWSPSLGVTLTVRSGFHPTAEAANTEVRSKAAELNYIPPRWWQWWRWGEHKIP